MTNFYAALGVEQNASLEEIKAAYRRLAKTCHPDKVPGKEAQFILIQEAYATLSDPDKRLAYDDSLAEETTLPHFTKENLPFYLPSDPVQYDHYQYINILFNLQGDERLTSGQKIVDVRVLSAKLHYVSGLLYPEECYLENRLSKLDKETEARKNKIVLNSNKILACMYVLCENNDKKKLYDFSIGVDQSEEMRRVGVCIGGVERLKQYINTNINMEATTGILVLQKANLLTPDNFSKLIQEGYHIDTLSDILTQLADNGLLTQDNFNVLMQYKKYALGIWRGLDRLDYYEILNQKYFDALIRSEKNVDSVASTLKRLHLLGILNEKNLQTVVHKIPHTDVWRDLDDMIPIGCITRAHSKALHWSGPKELKEFNEQLDNMLAHGLFLLSCDTNQGVRTMVLALDLKQDLKEFFEKTPQQQLRDKEQFKHSFITKLHSEDKYMTVHRDFWKVIVANVVIAFTGLGLLAIGLNLAINGRCFFAQTKREQFIDTMEHSAWLTSCT